MDANKTRIIVATLTLLLAATVVVWTRSRHARVDRNLYFYDLDRHELFVASAELVPPIDTPAAQAHGVLAMVYGCGDCAADKLKIAYLQTFSDDARDAMKAQTVPVGRTDIPPDTTRQKQLADRVYVGTLIALVPEGNGEPKWVPVGSPAAQSVLQNAENICGPGNAIACTP